MPQRVNKRFLILLTVVVAALAALLIASRLLLHRNPRNYAAAADAAAQAGDWEGAVGNYGRALSLGRGDPDLYVRYGIALEHRVGANPQNLKLAETAYQNALVVDPGNQPAARRLLDMYIQLADVEPSALVFGKLRDSAQKVAQLDPTDQRAVAYQHVAAILLSERGTGPVGQALNDEFDALAKFVRQDASDPNLPYYYGRGKVRLAAAALKDNDADRAAHLAQETASLLDAALALKGDSAELNWRASGLYAQLPRFDPAGATVYQDKAAAALSQARSLVKPTDVRYADIQVFAAVSATAHQKLDDAETILRDLYTAQPTSAVAELQLAGFLGRMRGKRIEAMAVLARPITGAELVGAGALRTRQQEEERIYQLARLQIDGYPITSDPAARQQLVAQIDANYKALADLIGTRDSSALLHLKAEIELIKGDPISAMATYRRALTVMEHADVADADLMYRAALLEAKEGQSGEAEKLFIRVAELNPGFMGPQVALADQLLKENSPEKAQKYIDSAEKLDPNSPVVTQLRVRQLVQQRQLDAARAEYAKLPEADTVQQMEKAKSAMLLANPADAQRLLEPLQKKSPEDATITSSLVQAYIAGGQADQARALVDQGLARNPKEVWLLILRQQLKNLGGKPANALDPALLAATSDFTRELLGYESDMNQGNIDSAASHLAAADHLKPDNARVHQLYFQLDLTRRRFDLAEQEVARLGKMNADGADGMLYQIRLAMAKGENAAAVQAARDLVAKRPEFAESYALLGTALMGDGQPDKAVTEFNNALDRQHDNLSALQGLIDAYFQLHQPDHIAQAIVAAQKLYPQSVIFRERAIDYDLIYSEHPEVAVTERQQLLDESPDDPDSYISLAQAALSVAKRDKTSNPEGMRQNLEQASDVLNKAMARWPKNMVIVGLLAQIRQYQGDAAGAEKLLLDLASSPQFASRPEPSLLLADFYLHAGNTDAQIKSLHDAFDKSGHSVDVELKLGDALAQARRYDDALSLLHDQNGADPRVAQQRLQTLSMSGRTDEAEREIKDALRSSPGKVELLDLLATTYISAGRLTDARQVATDAIAADPSDNDALYHQALVESQMYDGDLDLAIRDAMQLKQQNPASTKAFGLLADIYFRKHQPDDAVRTLEDGLKAAPQDRTARLRLLAACAASRPPLWSEYDSVVQEAENDSQLQGDTIWLVKDAYGLSARKQFDPAIAKIDQAIAAAPGDLTLVSEKLSILMTAGNYPAVIQAASDLEARGTRAWWVYLARGDAKAQTDKPAGLVDLDAALASSPDFATSARIMNVISANVGIDEAISRAETHLADPNWRLMSADLHVKKGDFAGAVALAAPLRQNTSISPTQHLHVFSLLAESYRIMKQPQDSRDAYLEALKIAPNDTETLNNLADLLADDLHEPQQALQYSQRAYDASRQSGLYLPSVSDTHGWVLTLCGGANAPLGLGILQKVVEEHQDFTYARYHLGEAYLRSAMPADAVKQLETAQTQVQQVEDQHGQVSQELKSAIAESLSRARQVLDGKADAGGR